MQLLSKGRAEVVEESSKIAKNWEGSVKFIIPKVIKLVNFIQAIYRAKVPFSKQNIMIRDKHTCAYCGCKDRKKLTIDHIVAISRGGADSWLNCITSCKNCNSYKGSKSLKESGMKLLFMPKVPSIMEFLKIRFDSLTENN